MSVIYTDNARADGTQLQEVTHSSSLSWRLVPARLIVTSDMN
jgi:hypothetical protein